MIPPAFATAADLLGSWFAAVEHGEPPARFELPTDPYAGLDLRPGQLALFGGAPGAGKTAFLLQLAVDLLRSNPDAKLLVANVEMSRVHLLNRIVSRLAGVPLKAIRNRDLSADQLARVRVATDALEPVAGRLAFLADPFSLEHVAAAGTDFGATVLMLDYIQRFTVGDGKASKREELETAATVCRRFCAAGALVLCASAVSRQQGRSGSNYSGLNLASFRGSSELEYGADWAFLFRPGEGPVVTLECVKARDDEPADLVTVFDGSTQSFRTAPSGLDAFGGGEGGQP